VRPVRLTHRKRNKLFADQVFTTFLHHTMILLDPVCDRLMQIPEHELLRWPWYCPPGVLLP